MKSSQSLHVAILCQWFPPEIAPIGVMLDEIAEELSRSGHKVSVVTGFPNYPDGRLFAGYSRRLFKREKAKDYDIIRCYISLPRSRSIFAKLANYLSFQFSSFVALLRLRKIDTLYVVTPPLSNAATALLIKGIKRTRFVLNVQDIYPDAAIHSGAIQNGLLIRLLSKFERWVYRHASKLLVIGDAFASNISSKGVESGKIHVVRNWIDLSHVVPDAKQNEFSRKHEIADKFVVLYSGTLGRVSGVEILVDVASALASDSEIIVVVIGDGAQKQQMIDKARNQKLSNMMFLPFQEGEVLSDLQASSDVSVLTMKRHQASSSIPSKVLGYMAASRPVVASVDQGSDIEALINDAGCGIVVNAEDTDAIADAIRDLKSDRQRALRLGANGRQFLEDNLQRDVCVAKIRKVIEASQC
jgi:colanic acid biosynthesis glycosyl transferase WcaI